jgi:hypothetical protein
MSTSIASSISGITSTDAKLVWRRFCESNGLTRTRRCTPPSTCSMPKARSPRTIICA